MSVDKKNNYNINLSETKFQNIENKKGLFSRLQYSLLKTANKLSTSLSNIFIQYKNNNEMFKNIEMQLLLSDIGIEITNNILFNLRNNLKSKHQTPDNIKKIIEKELIDIISPCEKPLNFSIENTPFIILIVGANGVGKTTTIGKLTKKLQLCGKSVILAAGDTFRAAAIEQLCEWGSMNNTKVIYQHVGSDSASVIYDAIISAKTKGTDIVIADTAGRFHNKDSLMMELKKIIKIIKKIDKHAPHEIMLILDATTGTNSLEQAEIFNNIISITGITMTKLDGTAKGCTIFSIAKKLNLPFRFIGTGEKIDDLEMFNAKDFISSLFRF